MAQFFVYYTSHFCHKALTFSIPINQDVTVPWWSKGVKHSFSLLYSWLHFSSSSPKIMPIFMWQYCGEIEKNTEMGGCWGKWTKKEMPSHSLSFILNGYSELKSRTINKVLLATLNTFTEKHSGATSQMADWCKWPRETLLSGCIHKEIIWDLVSNSAVEAGCLLGTRSKFEDNFGSFLPGNISNGTLLKHLLDN